MPTINKPFLLKLVLVLLAFAGVLIGVHTLQARRIPDALQRQATRAADAGKLDVAVHYLRQYLEFEPDDIESQEKLAELVRKRNPTARGQAELVFLYDRILRLDPDRHATRRDALALCLKLGRYSDAVTHAEALLKPFPAEAGLWQQLGAAQTGLNQLAEAKRSYETAITHAPDAMLGYQRLAQLVWKNMNDAPEARTVLDRMVTARPQDPEAFLIRARFENFTAEESGAKTGTTGGDIKRATQDLHRVLELDPENAEASLLLAEILQRGRDVPGAHTILKDAISLYPRDLRVIRSLAWLELVRGNVPAAVAVLEDGLKATPDGFDLLIPLADLLVQQGDTARTAEILKRLETRKAPAIQVKYLKARVAMRNQKWPEAIGLLDALRTDTRNLPGLEAQLNLLLAACHQKQADTDNEEKAFKRVTNADPRNVQARVGLATLYLNQGKFDDAARELEAATLSPYAPGSVHAQWVRLTARRLMLKGGTAEEWRKVQQGAVAAAPRFGPVSSEPAILAADVLIAQGKYAEAVQLLRKETARKPGDARLWVVLAETVADVGGTAVALAVVDEAQAAAGDGPDIRLVRARLYSREPGRVRPLAPLVERIDTWTEADQLRLLAGMVEVYDRLGDKPNVVATLRRLAARKPSDVAVWMKLAEQAIGMNDAKTAGEARAAVAKLDGADGPGVTVCDALVATSADAPKAIERLTAACGAAPSRADACRALARLKAMTGDEAEATRLIERAWQLEPGASETVVARLGRLCRTGGEDTAAKLVADLARDPRWAGEPFRRVVAHLLPTLPAEQSLRVIGWCKPLVEKMPGGLGWLAECYTAVGATADAETVLAAAVSSPTATPDDWVRFALRPTTGNRSTMIDETMTTARGKLSPAAYCHCAALLMESEAGRGWNPPLTNPADRRALAQARLALKLSKSEPGDAVKVLEQYLAGADLRPEDAGWARRNLAMLYAISTPVDRAKAVDLIRDATTDGGKSVEELRATASVLTTLGRYLEGKDRDVVLTRAAEALKAAHETSKSPKDLFNLSQLYRAAGLRKDSRLCLNKLLGEDGNNLYYLVSALEELTEDNDFATADAFANRLRSLYPGEFRAVAAVARYECKAGRPERALALAEGYTRAADLSAGDYVARSARVAELLDELVRHPQVRGTPVCKQMADAAAERYAAMVPTRAEAAIGIAGVLAADGRVAEAFAKIEQFARYLPTRTKALAGLAAVRHGGVTDRQFETVRGWLDVCLAEEPDSTPMRLNEAEFLALRQDFTRAAEVYDAVLRKDPRNVIALNNLAWLLAADPKQADRALDLVNRATREVGMTGDLLDTRARVRITLKQFDLAERDLAAARTQEPTALRAFHVAVLRMNQSPPNPADAAKAFKEARARGLDAKVVHPADLPVFRVLDTGN